MIQIVYKISSKIKPERIYIGSSTQYNEVRKKAHIRALKKNYHHSKKLQRHVNKYGIDDIEFEILEVVPNDIIMTDREQFYLDTLNPYFNTNKKAIGGPVGRVHSDEEKEKRRIKLLGNKHCLGYKHTDETKEKMSESQNKRGPRAPHSEATRAKMKETRSLNPKPSPNKGKKLSEEHCKNLALAHIGKKATDEQRKNQSERQKGRPSYMKGKTHSEESKIKISNSNIGRTNSPETIIKILETKRKNNSWPRGYKRSEESILKSSEKRKGQKRSDEARSKMSAAKGCIIINTITNETFKSIKIAAKLNGINESTLSAKVSGRINNDTPFIKLAS